MRGVAMTMVVAAIAFTTMSIVEHATGVAVKPDGLTPTKRWLRNAWLVQEASSNSERASDSPVLAPTPALPRKAREEVQDNDARADVAAESPTRFTYVDILVDSGDAPLAAYQLDVHAATGDVRIVGIEGGAHAAFADPPHYDPAAMMSDRVIIAAFSLAADAELPRGQTRIARLHVQIVGDVEPRFEAEITVAGDADAQKIPADVILQMGTEQS